jgi:hypothetical protein
MKDSELYEQYRNYNPDEDSSGTYGISIINKILKRTGNLERANKWLMLERCRKLERDAVA